MFRTEGGSVSVEQAVQKRFSIRKLSLGVVNLREVVQNCRYFRMQRAKSPFLDFESLVEERLGFCVFSLRMANCAHVVQRRRRLRAFRRAALKPQAQSPLKKRQRRSEIAARL